MSVAPLIIATQQQPKNVASPKDCIRLAANLQASTPALWEDHIARFADSQLPFFFYHLAAKRTKLHEMKGHFEMDQGWNCPGFVGISPLLEGLNTTLQSPPPINE